VRTLLLLLRLCSGVDGTYGEKRIVQETRCKGKGEALSTQHKMEDCASSMGREVDFVRLMDAQINCLIPS
jgi:hypothetical protein